MREAISSSRHLAAALFFIFTTNIFFALGLPQANVVGTTVADAPIPWITVDASGSAETHSPQVITTQGHRTTISQPPDFLISTATHTISPNGRPTTYTGLAPVASATASAGGGAFLTCSNRVGVDEPFCLPKRGSTLHLGNTYFVTWDPSYFPSSEYINLQLTLLTNSDNSSFSDDDSTRLTGQGSTTTTTVLSSSGFYSLHIPAEFLSNLLGSGAGDSSNSSSSSSSVPISISITYSNDDTVDDPNDYITVPGPVVFLAQEKQVPPPVTESGSNGSGSGINLIAIVVPIVIVVLLLALIGFCYFRYKKTGSLPLVGAFRMKSPRRTRSSSIGGGFGGIVGSSGYGIRKSRSQRVGGTNAAAVTTEHHQTFGGDPGPLDKEIAVGAVELIDRESWGSSSPTSPNNKSGSGRNVFREEVERQEREAAAAAAAAAAGEGRKP